jgi:hypothetical protein
MYFRYFIMVRINASISKGSCHEFGSKRRTSSQKLDSYRSVLCKFSLFFMSQINWSLWVLQNCIIQSYFLRLLFNSSLWAMQTKSWSNHLQPNSKTAIGSTEISKDIASLSGLFYYITFGCNVDYLKYRVHGGYTLRFIGLPCILWTFKGKTRCYSDL